jgi:hypothetical protein
MNHFTRRYLRKFGTRFTSGGPNPEPQVLIAQLGVSVCNQNFFRQGARSLNWRTWLSQEPVMQVDMIMRHDKWL